MGFVVDFILTAFMGFLQMGAIFALASLGNGYGSLVKNPALLWIGTACCVVPLLIGALYLWRGWTYFTLKPQIFAIICVLITLFMGSVGNLPRNLILVLKGIEPYDYSVVKGSVYYKGELLSEADAKSFKVIRRKEIATDQERVYQWGKIIPGAHGGTFKLLGFSHQTDRSSVYFEFKKLEGVDPETFKLLNDLVAVSGEIVFHRGEKVPELNGKNLKTMNGAFYISGKKLYDYELRPIQLEDPAPNFETFKEVTDKEKFGVFNDGATIYFVIYNESKGALKKLRGADPKTFRHLKDNYFADANKVYFLNRDLIEVSGVDPASFKFLSPMVWTSGSSAFIHGQKVEGIDASRLTPIGEKLFQYEADLLYFDLKKISLGSQSPRIDDLKAVPMKNTKNMTPELYSDGGHIYYTDYAEGSSEIILKRVAGADAATFHHLFLAYFADAKKVYWYSQGLKEISGADPASFVADEIVSSDGGITRDAKDKNRGYLSGN